MIKLTYSAFGIESHESSFSQLGNSGFSAISVKGKGLTNVKMFFQEIKFNFKATKF